MVVTKRDLIFKTAKRLGKSFTINDVKAIYTAITDVIKEHLQAADESQSVTIKLGDGLSLVSKIKMVDQIPRLWIHAKISRYHNHTGFNKT